MIPIRDIDQHFTFFLPWAGMEKAQYVAEAHADVKAAERMGKLFDELLAANPGLLERTARPARPQRLLHPAAVLLLRRGHRHLRREPVHQRGRLPHPGRRVGRRRLPHRSLHGAGHRGRRRQAARTWPGSRTSTAGCSRWRPSTSVPAFTKKARDLLIESGTLDLARDQPRHLRLDVPGGRHPRRAQRPRAALHLGAEHPQDHRAALPRRAAASEFDAGFDSVRKLEALLERISAIKVFDPACGSGNFLVIAYKELRKLEHAILERLAELDAEAPGAVRRVEDQHRELLRHRARRLRRRGRDPVAVDRQAPDERRVQGEVQPLDPADPAQGDRPDPAGQRDARRLERRSARTTASEIYLIGNPPYAGAKTQTQGPEGRLRRSSSGSARTRRTSTTSRSGSSRVPTTSRAREPSSRS